MEYAPIWIYYVILFSAISKTWGTYSRAELNGLINLRLQYLKFQKLKYQFLKYQKHFYLEKKCATPPVQDGFAWVMVTKVNFNPLLPGVPFLHFSYVFREGGVQKIIDSFHWQPNFQYNTFK